MNQRRIITTAIYDSPVGPLLLGEFDGRLCLCDWTEAPRHARLLTRLEDSLGATPVSGVSSCLETARSQLDEYFAGQRQSFSIPLSLNGTDFQKQVWSALSAIPCGATESYLGIARQMQKPSAVRAVAGAIGSNPLSIIIPCHRVIAADGSLTGYRGGLEAKRFLLNLENPNL